MVKKQEKKDVNKKVLSFFLLAFPTLIIAAIGIVGERTILNACLQIAVIFWQYVLLKQFVDDYYSVL